MAGPALIAKIRSKPGQRDALTTVLEKLVAATEEEPGTVTYLLHHDIADDDVVWMYERYESQDAFDAHGRSDTMRSLGAEITALLDAGIELNLVTLLGGKGA